MREREREREREGGGGQFVCENHSNLQFCLTPLPKHSRTAKRFELIV